MPVTTQWIYCFPEVSFPPILELHHSIPLGSVSQRAPLSHPSQLAPRLRSSYLLLPPYPDLLRGLCVCMWKEDRHLAG